MTTYLTTLMRETSRLMQAGDLVEATRNIQRVLGSQTATPPHRAPPASPAPAQAKVLNAGLQGDTFASGWHVHASATHRYKLYSPPGHQGRRLPLVVMLHGCTQNPDDFAAGTGMNASAREQGFFVLYPEQTQQANPSRCWNWFKHSHQARGRGEPAWIASLTAALAAEQGIDTRRIYIAGLSAGGAMAAITANAYPELFAAVGVHSGLPPGVAGNLPDALALMRSGALGTVQSGQPAAPPQVLVPTIVFHGDADQTVHPRNGEQVFVAAGGAGHAQVEQGVSASGRRFTRSTHHGLNGAVLAEHWLVHGAGHAWSGGSASGSFTDANGPDATHEMLRFFFSLPPSALH
jgi:poly(hydroxyalkanoate) depolymerase family esterase